MKVCRYKIYWGNKIYFFEPLVYSLNIVNVDKLYTIKWNLQGCLHLNEALIKFKKLILNIFKYEVTILIWNGPTSVVTLIVVYRNYENVKQNCFMWGKSRRYILYNNRYKKTKYSHYFKNNVRNILF